MVYLCSMGKHQWRVLVLSLLIAGCSSGPSSGDRQSRQVGEDAEYGDPMPINGKAIFGSEQSAVVLCPGARKNCSAPVHDDGTDDMSRFCWLKFTDSARADRERLRKGGRQSEYAGEYWMEGKGRTFLKPGTFGHLAQYPCQVEMTTIGKFEVAAPWFFAPPPEPVKNVR